MLLRGRDYFDILCGRPSRIAVRPPCFFMFGLKLRAGRRF
jgi:hypothetical protein